MKRKTFMLKGIGLMLVVLTLCGCGANENASNSIGETNPGVQVEQDVSREEVEEENQQETEQPQDDVKEEVIELGDRVWFSKEAGFYDEAFELELLAKDNHAIYYTLDGSDPTTSDTAILYSEKINIYDNTNEPNVLSMITDISLDEYNPPKYNIDKGIVIRAAFQDENGEFSEITTNSYFVGKTASYYSEMRVISMVTDYDYLFDPDDGFYMVGSGYYQWRENAEEVYGNGDTRNPTNYNIDGKDSEFPSTIQIFEDGKPVYTQMVGTRISGNLNRSNIQKSFRFYARKEYGASKMEYAFIKDLLNSEGELISKYDKVTLRAGGNDYILHFRDAFIQDLTKDLGLDYMASDPYILFLNGEFWGFYFMREKPEDYYIQSHYGIDDKQVTVLKNNGLDSGDYADLEEYKEFTKWAATADMTDPTNYKEFCEKVDVQNFMDYMTVETFVNNNDWANGYTNNWMAWRSNLIDENIPRADGKWRFILYDLDLSSGLYGQAETSYTYDSLNKYSAKSDYFNLPEILRNLCKNETFRQMFYDNYNRIIDEYFNIKNVSALLEEYTTSYGDATKETHKRYGKSWAADKYASEAANLRIYFLKRAETAKEHLNSFIENNK